MPETLTAPAAAPAAPASSTPSTPAAAPSTPSTPSTPTTPAAVAPPESGQSAHDYLKAAMADVKIEEPAAPTVEAPAIVDPPPVAEVVAAPVDPAVAEAPKVEEVKPVTPPNPLDAIGPLPAEKLATALEDADFAAAIEKHGFSKDQLLQTARDAALTSQFIEAVGTPEAAKIASESAGHFYDIEEGFTAIQNIDDFDKFMSGTMLPLSFEYGPDGQPVKLPNGQYKTDGTVERFFKQAENYSSQIKGSIIDKLVAANPDNEDLKDLQAAARIMRQFEENGYQLGAAPAGELTPQQKAREAELQTREQAIRSRDTEAKATAKKQSEDRINTDTDTPMIKLISEAVKQTALSPKLQEKAAEDIYVGIENAVKSNRNQQKLEESLKAHGLTDEIIAQVVASRVALRKTLFATIAPKVMAEYGISAVSQNQQDRSRTDAQLAADRQNPKGATTSGQPTRAGKLSTEQIRAQAEKDVLAANNGQMPADGPFKLLQRIMELESTQNPQQVA